MKKYTYPEELVLGDVIKVAGLRCVVMKTEKIFYRTPDSMIRVSLKSDDYLGKGPDIIVFFPRGARIKKSK